MANYDAFFAVLCIVGVLAIFYGPWQGLCVEFCRQIIFEQREKLFDLAADGRMDFRSEEYRHLRDFLNKSIRFSHDLTFWRFIANQALLRDFPRPDPSTVSVALSIEDRQVQKEALSIVSKTSDALLLSMSAKSLFALFCVGLFMAFKAMGLVTGIRGRLRRLERGVQREVEVSP